MEKILPFLHQSDKVIAIKFRSNSDCCILLNIPLYQLSYSLFTVHLFLCVSIQDVGNVR